MPRAVLSVHDKNGIVEFAEGLVQLGFEIISTGGTASMLSDAGVAVVSVSDVTGFPEIMDGRIKTLHPAIAAGILARRDREDDMQMLQEQGIEPIDVVAVNLYPFEQTVARPEVELQEALEQIDIGGPTMLRAAAKNHADVLVVCDPADYSQALECLRSGDRGVERRRRLANKVFRHVSNYDGAIARYLNTGSARFPETQLVPLEKVQDLRYGENPDQEAAFYRISDTPDRRGVAALVQHHGKELSYNNILDLDGALMSLAPFASFERPVCAIIKHTTPSGIAAAATTADAYRRALQTDPLSAFGSVVAFTRPLDPETAEAVADLFVECVIAPGYYDAAMERLAAKKNLRILSFPKDSPRFLTERSHLGASLEIRGVPGGALLQTRPDPPPLAEDAEWRVVTKRKPDASELRDLRFAWAAIWGVKSNAILLARDEAAIGIGAGQMSRVDASKFASWKAREAGHDLESGCVLASDAFFPFRDGIDAAVEAGVTAIVQPGGSIRDEEVVAVADEHDLAMVFTGRRLFRH